MGINLDKRIMRLVPLLTPITPDGVIFLPVIMQNSNPATFLATLGVFYSPKNKSHSIVLNLQIDILG